MGLHPFDAAGVARFPINTYRKMLSMGGGCPISEKTICKMIELIFKDAWDIRRAKPRLETTLKKLPNS